MGVCENLGILQHHDSPAFLHVSPVPAVLFSLPGFSSSPWAQSTSPSQTQPLLIHLLSEHWNWSTVHVLLPEIHYTIFWSPSLIRSPTVQYTYLCTIEVKIQQGGGGGGGGGGATPNWHEIIPFSKRENPNFHIQNNTHPALTNQKESSSDHSKGKQL